MLACISWEQTDLERHVRAELCCERCGGVICRSTGPHLQGAVYAFFALSEIPLIPGSTLYYCMLNAAGGHADEAVSYGLKTFAVALGIAAGMSIVWALCDFSRKAERFHRRRHRQGV